MYSFPNLEPVCCSASSSNCCFLTCIHISQKAGQGVWYSHLLKNFPWFIVIYKVSKAEVDIFLELSCFFHDPVDIGNAKECSNYCTTALISHASKVMLKILQARLQQYLNRELPDVQAGFRKGRGTRDQIANICWIIEKARVPEKHLFLLYWLCQNLWLCGSQ